MNNSNATIPAIMVSGWLSFLFSIPITSPHKVVYVDSGLFYWEPLNIVIQHNHMFIRVITWVPTINNPCSKYYYLIRSFSFVFQGGEKTHINKSLIQGGLQKNNVVRTWLPEAVSSAYGHSCNTSAPTLSNIRYRLSAQPSLKANNINNK